MITGSNNKSIFIIVGFTEGGWHARQMEAAARKRGYTISDNIQTAQYVVAHSGGCYTIPPLTDGQVLLLINPTYWPGKPLIVRGLTMLWRLVIAIRPGNKPLYHVRKTAYNIFYLFHHARLNLLMVQRARTYKLSESINHAKTILVRNNFDPWITPNLQEILSTHPAVRIERLPGEHDDCWLNPDTYLDMLEEHAW